VLQGLRLSGSPSDVAQQVRAALARPTSLVLVIDLLRQMDDRNTGVVERAEWGKVRAATVHLQALAEGRSASGRASACGVHTCSPWKVRFNFPLKPAPAALS
jgi:hypothetical protein